ncbi:hypothetical protein MHBO_000236, partial [Bonamia ostreae]
LDSMWKVYDSNYIPKKKLLGRYFSASTSTTLRKLYEKVLDRQNSRNLTKLLNAMIKRDDISTKLKNINCSVLSVIGLESSLYEDCLYAKNQMNPKLCEFVEIDNAGHLLTEESFDKLIEPVILYLNSFGFTVRDKL